MDNLHEQNMILPEASGENASGESTALQGLLTQHTVTGEYPAATATAQSIGLKNLRQYWSAIRRRLWLIILISCLMTGLAALYISRTPSVYQATSVVQVDLENFPTSTNQKGGAIIVSNPVNDPTYFNTQLKILSSAGLMRRVIKVLDLENNDSFLRLKPNKSNLSFGKLLQLVGLGKKKEELPAKSETLAPPDSALSDGENLAEINRLSPYVDALQDITQVKNVTGTRLIEVNVQHTDKDMAVKIANTVVETFVTMNMEKNTEASTNTGDFLQKRVADLQARIRTGEERLLNYGKSNQILSLDPSQNTVVDRLASLNKQLIEAENERTQAEAAYRVGSQEKVADAQSDVVSKNIADMEGRLGELKQKRAGLLVKYTTEYPEVQSVTEQIALLENQIKQARTRSSSVIVTNLEARYRQALEREQVARAAFDSQRRQTLTQNEAAINYRIIQQEIDTNKTLLDGLLQESKTNEIRTAGTQNNIHITDFATVPRDPISPARKQFVLITFFVSLVIGLMLALALDFLDDAITTMSDVENVLRLPTLATIPVFASTEPRRVMSIFGSSGASSGNSNGKSLIKHENGFSLPAESYRQLRTSLLLSTAGHAPKKILLTSSTPSEGKTTTCVNLSTTLTQSGAKTLIIDADLRRPQLHKIFGVENYEGLSTILSQEMDEEEILGKIALSEDTNTYVLTSGPRPPNPAELIGSDQMSRLLKILEKRFAHIIIDSPPILSFTDGLLLSALVDGVVLVVTGGRTKQSVALRSKQLLQSVGAKLTGVVLNKVNLRSEDYYYNYEYYGKHYESDEEE